MHTQLKDKARTFLLTLMALALTSTLFGCMNIERLMTQEESIDHFVKNRKDFEYLRDKLLADSHKTLTIYQSGGYNSYDKKELKLSPQQLEEYLRLVKKLGLINVGKSSTEDGKPIIEFTVSATGFLGDGQIREIWYTQGHLDHRYGQIIRFDSKGWYDNFRDSSLRNSR